MLTSYNIEQTSQVKLSRARKRENKKTLKNLPCVKYNDKKKQFSLYVSKDFKDDIYSIREWHDLKTSLLNLLIAYCRVHGGSCRPSQNTLAKHLGCSSRQVRTYLTELESDGHIFYKQIGFEQTCRYVVSEFYSFKGIRRALAHFLPALARVWERNFLLLNTNKVISRNISQKVKENFQKLVKQGQDFLDGSVLEAFFEKKMMTTSSIRGTAENGMPSLPPVRSVPSVSEGVKNVFYGGMDENELYWWAKSFESSSCRLF